MTIVFSFAPPALRLSQASAIHSTLFLNFFTADVLLISAVLLITTIQFVFVAIMAHLVLLLPKTLKSLDAIIPSGCYI